MSERMSLQDYRRLVGTAKPGDLPQPKKKRSAKAVKADAQELLCLFLDQLDLPPYKTEWHFHEERQWRFDVAFPTVKFAVEIEGITREGGRHQRMEGFLGDLEKYEAAMLDGWTVYRCSTAMVRNGHASQIIARMLAQ